jgi:hypothetical protein
MVLFYCDLSALSSPTTDLPSSLKVERHRNQTDLTQQDLQEITSFWNPQQARRNIKKRFELGASLWLIKFKDELAGYGWTLQGRTVEPHYFPLGENDAQFLDFHVFPKYRGRAMDWFLMTHILHRLAADGGARAFGEAAEWAGVPLERVSTLLGHQSTRVTEKHYSPWVAARQEQLEQDVRRTWDTDLVALTETKGTYKVHGEISKPN